MVATKVMPLLLVDHLLEDDLLGGCTALKHLYIQDIQMKGNTLKRGMWEVGQGRANHEVQTVN